MAKRRGSRENNVPELRVSKVSNGVSDFRKEQLSQSLESGDVVQASSYVGSALSKKASSDSIAPVGTKKINRGEWQPGDGISSGIRTGSVNMQNSKLAVGAIAHGDTFQKRASIVGGSSASSAGSNVERMAPEVYSPLFTMANLNLPRDWITINAWCRNFFQLHPIVRNAITLHATYPISKLNLKCHDRKVLQFFEDMIEEIDLLSVIGDVALEFWKLGNCFPYAELDENAGKWSKIIIQNPDYINVKKSVLSSEPIILLRPDAALQRLVMSNNPADVQLRKQIPEKILYHIRNGQSVPLDNFNVSHLKMLSSPYDIRGTSIIVSVFKDLCLFDKLRESKFAQADGMVNPLTLVKVGGATDGDYRATQEDIEFFRQILEEAQYDKDFKLVTHAGVTIEKIGSNSAVLDVTPDIEQINKNIYTGLMVPMAVIDQEGPTYSAGSIGLEVLRQRYFNFRAIMAKWLVKKIFAPISEIQEFYEYKGGEKKLIVPEIEWNQMNLYDLQDYIGNISNLVGAKQASVQTLYKSLGLNYEEERVRMRQEAIHDSIRRREEEALGKMTLSELRGLDPEKEIMEPVEEQERAAEAMPPDAGAAGGGGAMPGGLPELAPPPMPEASPMPSGDMGPGAAPAGGPPKI